MSIEIGESTLPTEPRKYTMGYPTWMRWGSSLPAAVGSVTDALEDAGVADQSAILIADGSPSKDISNADRAKSLEKYYGPDRVPQVPIFIINQEDQEWFVGELGRRLPNLSESVIRSVVFDSSCGGNREKLAVVTGAYVVDTDKQMVLGYIDDDIKVPRQYKRAVGFGERPNSQAIIDTKRNGHTFFESRPNGSIAKNFLHFVGKTAQELESQFSDFQSTTTMVDSMHRQLHEAQQNGAAVFEVNPEGDSIEDGLVWGVSVIKHGRPDYRTVEVSKAALLDEFPEHELPILSYPAGPSIPFAFEHNHSNVDLAFSAFHVDNQTARHPGHYLNSKDISLENPYQTVATNTRADNEPHQQLLGVIRDQTGRQLLYVTGVDFQVEHLREASGYRPSIIEQACTSLVDHEYAVASNELMRFDEEGFPYMEDDAIDMYEISEKNLQTVYTQLQELASIAHFKKEELKRRQTHSSEEEKKLRKNITLYEEVIEKLRVKLGVAEYEKETGQVVPIAEWDNAAFDQWSEQINITGRKQLRHLNGVWKAYPSIIRATQEIIQDGYPVSMVRPEGNPSISVSGEATKPKSW